MNAVATYIPAGDVARAPTVHETPTLAGLAWSVEEFRAMFGEGLLELARRDNWEAFARTSLTVVSTPPGKLVSFAEDGTRAAYRRLRKRLIQRLGAPMHWPEGDGQVHTANDVTAACSLISLFEQAKMPVPSPSSSFDGAVGFYLDRNGIYADITVKDGQVIYLVAYDDVEVEDREPFDSVSLPPKLGGVVRDYMARV